MFIPMNFEEVQETKPVPAGKYNLVIGHAEATKTRAGMPQFKTQIAIEGQDNAPNVTHFISLPNETDDANKAAFKGLLLKRFLVAFKIPVPKDGIDTDALAASMLGCRWDSAELTLSEPDDNGNVYNRLVLPRLKDEGVPRPPR